MRPNGECIYGANASPFKEKPDWGYITSKPGKLFLIVKNLPDIGGKISFPALRNDFQKAYLLENSKEELPVFLKDDKWEIKVTKDMHPDPFVVIVIEITGTPSPR